MYQDVKRSLTRLDLTLMLALVAVAGTALVLWSQLGHEIIPVHGGIGYDGTVYSSITRDPVGVVLGHRLDVHRVQRIVPSLVVHVMLRPFGLQTSNPAIVVGFQVLNYVLMALCAAVWWTIARRLNLSRVAGWVGFLALLVNYGILKFQAYSPVMTDTFGFFLGLLVVWCMVFRRNGLLPLVAVVGAFTWPTVTYSALGLYALSRKQPPLRASRWWGIATAGALAVVVPLLAVRTWRCGPECGSVLMRQVMVPDVIWFSVAFLAAWIFLGFRPLLELLTVPNVLRAVDWRRALVSVALLVAMAWVHHQLADPSFRTVSRTTYNTVLGGIVKPAGFLVAHAVYYGPAIPLLVLTWRRAVDAVREFGLNAVALTAGFLFIAITCEARIITNEWPLFALLAAIVVDRLEWRGRALAVFAALTVIASRLWFPVNHGPYSGNWRNYPDQYYGMSMGLKMTVPSYLMMGTACLLCALVLLPLTRPWSRFVTEDQPLDAPGPGTGSTVDEDTVEGDRADGDRAERDRSVVPE